MMKKAVLPLLLLAMFFLITPADAQDTVLNQVIISNGGVFGSPGNRVFFGRYNPADMSYMNFDSIPGSYTNFAYVDNNEVYMNADSFVFRYELDHYKRLGVFKSMSVVDMARYNDVLVVIKGFGAQGAHVDILDTGTFAPVGTIPQITNEARDIAIVGDTAYITHNLLGTIDQFPPFKVFSDSIGYIAIIDLPNRKFVRNIKLGTAGAGANQIFVEGKMLYTINEEAGSIGRYRLGTNVAASTSVPAASKGAGIKDSLLYANFGQGIGSFNIHTLKIEDTSIVNRSMEAVALDTIATEFYATYTDFFSFGSLGRYDVNGNGLDSVSVRVSPQAIAMEYRVKPIAEFISIETAPLVFDTVSLVNLSIYDPVNFNWTITPSSFVFVKGTDEHSPSPFVVFTDTGVYTIKLIVSDVAAADTAERVNYIMVRTEQMNLNFAVSDRSPEKGDTVIFTSNYDFMPDSFRWLITPSQYHYVNGTDSLSANIDVVFDTAGFFSVTLVGYSPFDTDSIVKFHYIEVDDPSGIAENQNKNISIFPNPASSFIFIKTKENMNSGNISILSVDGRELISSEIKEAEIRLDISHLEKGVYFIEISSGTERMVRRIVKF